MGNRFALLVALVAGPLAIAGCVNDGGASDATQCPAGQASVCNGDACKCGASCINSSDCPTGQSCICHGLSNDGVCLSEADASAIGAQGSVSCGGGSCSPSNPPAGQHCDNPGEAVCYGPTAATQGCCPIGDFVCNGKCYSDEQTAVQQCGAGACVACGASGGGTTGGNGCPDGEFPEEPGGPCEPMPDSCANGCVVCNCPEKHGVWCHPSCEFAEQCDDSPNPDYPCSGSTSTCNSGGGTTGTSGGTCTDLTSCLSVTINPDTTGTNCAGYYSATVTNSCSQDVDITLCFAQTSGSCDCGEGTIRAGQTGGGAYSGWWTCNGTGTGRYFGQDPSDLGSCPSFTQCN